MRNALGAYLGNSLEVAVLMESLAKTVVRSSYAPASGILVTLWLCGAALGADSDPTSASKSDLPNVYLDLRTIYTSLPANTLSIGFSSPPLLAILSTIGARTSFSSPPLQGRSIDVPLTIDLNDRISMYGGFSASSSKAGAESWTTLTVSSWNIGAEVDAYQQNGGNIPTLTIQSTLTRSIPDAPLATTTLNTIVEANYALNEDETRGWLAGIQYTNITVDTALARVNPNVIGYLGGYHQWDNNWKLTGRVGLQSFGGGDLLNQTVLRPFTQPVIRLDLDYNDDDDNRLFGVMAQIAWTPKPAYQLILRTPLYLHKN